MFSDPPQPDQLEILLVQEWQAAQLGQQHVAYAINKVIEAWQRDRAELVNLRVRLAAAQAELAAMQPVEPT